jgi:hypothetical protein
MLLASLLRSATSARSLACRSPSPLHTQPADAPLGCGLRCCTETPTTVHSAAIYCAPSPIAPLTCAPSPEPYNPTALYLSLGPVTGAADCTTASRHASRGAPRSLCGLDLRW